MAHTDTTMRRTLRREAPSTVGLLADAQDFAAMRHYRTFTFDDHTVYLQQVESLLKTLTAQGVHTTVALFDPEDFGGSLVNADGNAVPVLRPVGQALEDEHVKRPVQLIGIGARHLVLP